MSRGKNEHNDDLPQYLYAEKAKNYWKYAHPTLIQKHGKAKFFSASKSEAISLAERSNEYLDSQVEINLLSESQATSQKRRGPKSDAAFSTMADGYFSYWQYEMYEDEERQPKEATVYITNIRVSKLKTFFGDRPIHSIDTVLIAKFYDTIGSAHTYNKFKNILTKIFDFAKRKGHFPSHYSNPASSAALRRVAKATERMSMEPQQFHDIYERAADWLQIMMDIVLQTSLRQQDVLSIKWEDIENGVLYVVVKKSKTNKRNDRKVSFLKFDLKQNPKLAAAIQHARVLKMKVQGMRTAFRDCPYVIFITDLQRLNSAEKTKEHPLQVTKRYANGRLKKYRDESATETPKIWHGWTDRQMPAFHGIRALSLQILEDMGKEDQWLQDRAAHKSFGTTEGAYLGRNDPRWSDVSSQSVETSLWRQGEHRADSYVGKE